MSDARDNPWGTAGVALALAGLVGALRSEHVVVAALALCGVLFSGAGIWRAVKVDHGIARSVTGVLLGLFAIAVWVFSRGGSTAV